MKKILLLLAVPFVFFTAQADTVTQAEADNIVLERMSQETRQHAIYAKDDVQEKVTITSIDGEVLEVNYKFWIYYVKYIDNAGKYIIVKESNGNLLEINVRGDAKPEDLGKWRIVEFVRISGIWRVKALSISGELTNIGSPPDNAYYSDISIEIPNATQGYIDGHTFVNTIGFEFEIKEHQRISLAKNGLFDGTRIAEDNFGMAFRDHIMFNVVKFYLSDNELQFVDSQDNPVIVFINHLNKD